MGHERISKPVPLLPAVRRPRISSRSKSPSTAERFWRTCEGKAIFVPLALPGEQARVRIVDDKRGYATAEAEEIVTAAPQRVAPACPHFGACGGCQYQHAQYAAQLAYKQEILRETLERGGVYRARRHRGAGWRAVGVPQSHSAGIRCGWKCGLPRAALACGDSHRRVPHCRAAACTSCARRERNLAEIAGKTCARTKSLSFAMRKRRHCW